MSLRAYHQCHAESMRFRAESVKACANAYAAELAAVEAHPSLDEPTKVLERTRLRSHVAAYQQMAITYFQLSDMAQRCADGLPPGFQATPIPKYLEDFDESH